jgi:uncharacterized protein YdhG (YjbR/CyaY superfamily)
MRPAKSSAGSAAATKRNAAPNNVDEYLAGVPEPARTTLNRLRAAIRSAVPPEATEGFSYGLPAFKYKKPVIAFAAFADHCSVFPMSGSVINTLQEELKGFEVSDGTIRFPLDRPLPAPLIRKLIKARLLAARQSVRFYWHVICPKAPNGPRNPSRKASTRRESPPANSTCMPIMDPR